ncbi:MAG: hypothetical protein ACRCUS_08015 [Anaerovoracaceae bacterium]
MSNKKDTTTFTITHIEKQVRSEQGIPSRFFYGNTFINVYCNVKGATKSPNINSNLYMRMQKWSKSMTNLTLYFGNEKDYTRLGISPDGVYSSERDSILTFTDTEHFEIGKEITTFPWVGHGKGIISYIWSKHYGLLQYTTADSLVWTRINIEEPDEK